MVPFLTTSRRLYLVSHNKIARNHNLLEQHSKTAKSCWTFSITAMTSFLTGARTYTEENIFIYGIEYVAFINNSV